jgi:DNA-binding MarR family transcriptional regulator
MAGQIDQEIRNSKPLASIEVEAALNIQRTGSFLTRWTDEVLRPAGLRGDEYNVLRILRGAGPQGHPSSEIRSRMIQDTERFPAILHMLRTRGLIEGALRITITEAGRVLLTSVDGLIESAVRERVGQIEPHKLRTVIEVMERLRSGT